MNTLTFTHLKNGLKGDPGSILALGPGRGGRCSELCEGSNRGDCGASGVLGHTLK